MGRDQELRDAARDGNIPKLESFLSGKRGSIMLRYFENFTIGIEFVDIGSWLTLPSLGNVSDQSLLFQ